MRAKRLLTGAVISMLVSLSPPAIAQSQQTLSIEPEQGKPGSEVIVSGEGYPDDPRDITVVWRDSGETMEADVRIENGVLQGTALVPESAVVGQGDIEVCAFAPGDFDDVYGPDDYYCGVDRFVIMPTITISPESGTPGSSFTVTGSAFPENAESNWEIRWGNDIVAGAAVLEANGTMTGEGTVPLESPVGGTPIALCLQVTLRAAAPTPNCFPAETPFQVRLPEIFAIPAELIAGSPFELTGEEWCCSGERGEVIEVSTGDVWGDVVVDENRSLRGAAVAPEGTEQGQHVIEVCVLEICRQLTLQIMPPPPPTTVPPGECGLESGSLVVDPISGLPGSQVQVTLVGAEQSPADCQVTLRLGGEDIGDVVDVTAGEQFSIEAVVPGSLAPGTTELVAFDTGTGNSLASTFFNVEGVSPDDSDFPWLWLAAGMIGALALFGIIRLGTRSTRGGDVGEPKPPDPEHVDTLLPVVPARWLEARLYVRNGLNEDPVPYFRSGSAHRIEVRVGPPDVPGGTAPTQMMRVVFTEPNLLVEPQTAEVMVGNDGAGSPASLSLSVPEGAASVDGRLILLDGNRVVHTARLPATVGQPASGQAGNVAEIETVVRAATVPPLGAGVSTAVVVEQGRFPILTQVSSAGPARIIRLPESGAEAIETIRHRLAEIVDAPDDFAGLDRESTRLLLIFLANHGRLLRSAVVDDFLGEELAASPSLQLVSAEPDAYLPLEFAYDFPAPREDAAVCPRAGDTLRSLDLLTPCPGPHDPSVVCPTGFWGIAKVIERHAFQARDDLPAGFLARAQPISGRDRIVLGEGLLVAASERIDGHDPETSIRLRKHLDEVARTVVVDSWTAWDAHVAQEKPSLLVLLPHTVYSDELALPGLEIGASERRWASAIGETRMVPGTPAIVLLLGCETAVAGAISYERLPGNLRKAGASIVVATLTDVLGRQAAPLAERLVALLVGNAYPARLGESIVRLRRQLIAEGVPMVLALAVFGDADWLVGRP